MWTGRALALLGIMAVALNLRTSVAALSPILSDVGRDIPLSGEIVALLGILPPAAFAIGGLLGPRIARALGIEASLVLAMLAAAIGHLARALTPDVTGLIAATAFGLLGMGVANVLLPPIVKRYFPRRIALVTSTYATLIAVSTALPPLIAAPTANAAGWRVSLGMWAALAIVAALPWLGLGSFRPRAFTRNRNRAVAEPLRAASVPLRPVTPLREVWRSPLAWALAAVFSVSAMNGYAIFAWLPELLIARTGMSSAHAGSLLSLYAAMGIPLALIIPGLTVRSRNPLAIMLVGIAATITGNLGLIIAPGTTTWVWVAAAGLGPLLFPVCLALINLRTRTEAGSAQLSGFAQGIGYVLGVIGPIAFGILHETTGGWTAPMVFLTAVAAAGIAAALVLAKPGFFEDGR
ncbi:MFS transporter [soil metagenome]